MILLVVTVVIGAVQACLIISALGWLGILSKQLGLSILSTTSHAIKMAKAVDEQRPIVVNVYVTGVVKNEMDLAAPIMDAIKKATKH